MKPRADRNGQRRSHLVLVPGFVGFDALGQLEYYSGVTSVFRDWQGDGPDVSLHYFDNFPTASVALRADGLLGFLAKRVGRGIFASGDRVVLVGHSTGALDIRKALDVLRAAPEGAFIRSDGQLPVPCQEILAPIEGLCFLSAPHFGTNLAEVAHGFDDVAQGLAQLGARGLWLNRAPISTLRRQLARRFPDPRSSLLRALMDALNESDEEVEQGEAAIARRTAEREARAELALWLQHMAEDYSVWDDLRSGVAIREEADSPAHFNRSQRERELLFFREQGIRTFSVATRVRAPSAPPEPWFEVVVHLLRRVTLGTAAAAAARAGSQESSAMQQLSALWRSARSGATGLSSLEQRPRLLFDLFYALCAHGPFRSPHELWPGAIQDAVPPFPGGVPVPTRTLLPSDNDGVVNTLSMLWPPPDPTRPEAHVHWLLECDHGKIIGHLKDRPVRPTPPRGTGRRYYAYDFFRADTPFEPDTFREVWRAIFDFAVSDG